MSGMWSFSSNFCCFFSSVSIQWWQQRIFSSSFSSSIEVTLLKLLMLPLREPIPLLPPPAGRVWDCPGLPGTHRASRVPLMSFSVTRQKKSGDETLMIPPTSAYLDVFDPYGPKEGGRTPCIVCTWWSHRGDSGAACCGCWICFRSRGRMGHPSHLPTTPQTSRLLKKKNENV